MASKNTTKDSMKSTWRLADKNSWTVNHWLIELLNAHPFPVDKPAPVHKKSDPIPYLPQAPQHLWVLFYAFIPLLIHQAWIHISGSTGLSRVSTVILYTTAFSAFVVREVQILRRLGEKHGFLDGEVHERDGVPDVGVGKVVAALYKTAGFRMSLATLLTYDPTVSPAHVVAKPEWWALLVFQIGIYPIVLDFWFYVYHRAMHDVDYLWKYHRTHHLTKHPNALLTAYADHEQEFFDMIGVPALAYLTFWAAGFPLGFYDWWVCHQYIVYTEVWGHSGIRVHVTPPTTFAWLLRKFRLELVLEDHDLHHRQGWRKTHNYGKQTRVWDRAFGTCAQRIESIDTNIDYVDTADMPIL